MFFILWAINVISNLYETQMFSDCETKIKQLHSSWKYAYNTLNNCYKNNIPSCEVDVPYLKE